MLNACVREEVAKLGSLGNGMGGGVGGNAKQTQQRAAQPVSAACVPVVATPAGAGGAAGKPAGKACRTCGGSFPDSAAYRSHFRSALGRLPTLLDAGRCCAGVLLEGALTHAAFTYFTARASPVARPAAFVVAQERLA